MINNPYLKNLPFGAGGLPAGSSNQMSSPLSFSSPMGPQPIPMTLSGGFNQPPSGMVLNPNYNPGKSMQSDMPRVGSADYWERQMYIPGGNASPKPYQFPPPLMGPPPPALPPEFDTSKPLDWSRGSHIPFSTAPQTGGNSNLFQPYTDPQGRQVAGGKPAPPMGGNLLPPILQPQVGSGIPPPGMMLNPNYNPSKAMLTNVPLPGSKEDLERQMYIPIGNASDNMYAGGGNLYNPETGKFENITQPSTGAPPVANQPPSGTTPPSSGGGSVVDFLFEGSAPTPGSSRETSRVELPSWYTEYAKDMLGRARGVANMPYQPYSGPRIAPFTETEKAGMRETFGAAGSYKPYLGAAGDVLGTVGGKSSFGAAAPFIGEGAGFTREAAYGTAMPIAERYFQDALGRTPTGAAAPYTEQAARMFPEAAAAYMSPYTKGVVEELGNIGLEQLQEKFLPEIGEEFIRAGQFGGSRMGEFGARALRDVQRSVLGEQRKALESGYKTAADIYGTDASRQAELARLMGTFGGQEQEFMGDVGKTLAGIRQEDLGRILKAGGQLGDFGRIAGALSSEDLNRLLDISGRYADLGGLAQKYGLVGGEAITGVGEKERGMNQANLELAYKDFLEQRNYPKEQAEYMAKMLAGINLPETRISETITAPGQPAGETGVEKIGKGVKGGLEIIDLIRELFGKEG